ncbi:MAG: 30S ribosomal protein S4 [Gemmatimonadales bacterium]|jgi:small subunit ribosomal protein S4|nr:30S ribosomal protein S4 [Gemmatimonadales bacterium]MDG2240335.1 30S ribosomal protein S4 [Longimicrobiales bacterium]NCG31726.1 30S ribosomal protein S4 [Pseudomonadota bacterium]MBT3957096.1 30S ribosomal protein S4 [Gemmatimonadales bacterium]MBT4185644.1 30S ribosomal protein S4 [Gemmatimonadales bacterium]
MARYTGPVCKLCRREGQKLFLKGQKCYTEKCPVERRAYPPGQHGPAQARRRKQSDYAVQLREKQKVKRIYGLGEKQFRSLFERAAHIPGITGENLIVSLETRLDNIVFRMGLAPSRSSARQLIRHRHVEVNGRTVDVPSFVVKPGHEIAVRAKSKDNMSVQASLEARTRPSLPDWLALDEKARMGRLVRQPTRADIPLAAQEQLIVELYSK